MILGTLGSDKSVTTLDAIMTEIFTGIKPDEIRIYREEESKDKEFYAKLESVLKLLGVNAKVVEVVIGDTFSAWKEKMTSEKIDILDVTPGRKYMAYAAAEYSSAKEVRYAYLKRETEGYRVFGYVSPKEIKVINLRDGSEISYTQPTIQGGDANSKLNPIGLTAFYNLLSLSGKVNILVGGDELDNNDNYAKMCLIRAGYRVFEEENKIEELAKQGYYFLADTNVYINLGFRIQKITKGRLLASRSAYNELSNKTKNTQKQSDTIIFDIGMYTYTKIHRTPPIISEYKPQGDIPLINEARILKDNIVDQIAIITGDVQVANRAQSQKVKSILLSQLKPSNEGNIGELLFCLSYQSQYYDLHDPNSIKKEVEITLDGRRIAILRPYIVNEGVVNVIVKDPRYNYAKLVEELSSIISRQ